jgi:cob(I)alamin adenosyltransferase
MVKLNRIVTRTGDDGRTSLGDGALAHKADPRVQAIGDVDEANACLGVARLDAPPDLSDTLLHIQNDLFDLGADIAAVERDGLKVERLRVVDAQVEWLEARIEAVNAGLPPLDSFVLPGGDAVTAHLHLARTVVRRAERSLNALAFSAPVNPVALRYLNRLSDLLFVLARAQARASGVEILWQPGLHRERDVETGAGIAQLE